MYKITIEETKVELQYAGKDWEQIGKDGMAIRLKSRNTKK
jgi:hypothetical protein